MCPLRLIPKLFVFNEDELMPELRAQRLLNKGRLPELTRYIVSNRNSYVFSAITASVDGDVKFEPLGDEPELRKIGTLQVSMDARFVINDGQHRRAAIENALRDAPELGDESIAVVFFLDTGLARCQQMFADLNRHAIRPSTSLGVLYDHRDSGAKLVKLTVLELPIFKDLTEMERSTLSARSRKLFTLSALYNATESLVAKLQPDAGEELGDLIRAYWAEVARHFPEWEMVHAGKMASSEVRRDLLHSHGIVLQALGRIGNQLLREQPRAWKKPLAKLRTINWARSNSRLWEGRATVGGKVSKASTNVTLTANAIKSHLGLGFTPEEQRIESHHARGANG